uniref:Uncharacterized protein n=1 Tax=viral metagenome TaxID=1070528 RepID=A0A6C0EC82_9ZZZZ
MIDLFFCLSLILLIILIIMITIYITKINSQFFLTCKDIRDIQNNQKIKNNINNVYDFKISREFDKMFNNNDILNQYQTFNNDDENIKVNINN